MKYVFKAIFNIKSKKYKYNFENKKAFMALDALIGTMLSVIALFFLLQLMYMFFFQDNDSNLKIAKNDAESIVDFVNTYSSSPEQNLNPYANYDNCFYILKLQNLENFQLQTKTEKTYSYIINKAGVYIVDNENTKQFELNYDLDKVSTAGCNLFNKNMCFNNEVSMKKDETSSGSFAKVDIFFIFSIGESGKFTIDNDLEKSFIYLTTIPSFFQVFFARACWRPWWRSRARWRRRWPPSASRSMPSCRETWTRP